MWDSRDHLYKNLHIVTGYKHSPKAIYSLKKYQVTRHYAAGTPLGNGDRSQQVRPSSYPFVISLILILLDIIYTPLYVHLWYEELLESFNLDLTVSFVVWRKGKIELYSVKIRFSRLIKYWHFKYISYFSFPVWHKLITPRWEMSGVTYCPNNLRNQW